MTRFHLVQADLAWESPTVNCDKLGELMADCRDGAIVLPEMFSTGFSMASKRLAEPMNGPTVQWIQAQAESLRQPVCGSVIIEDGHYFNRFIWASPDVQPMSYDKRHLFRMAGEDEHYAAGRQRLVIDSQNVKILPQVCYDLRFPVWSRNQGDYDVMLIVANWPKARREQWLALLRARAIENLCYVVAVNRVGIDGNQVAYSGDSCVIDFLGNTLLDLGNKETCASIDLDMAALKAWRTQFPAHLDADEFRLSP